MDKSNLKVDLQVVLNNEWLKEELTLEERATLLCELCSELIHVGYEITEKKNVDGLGEVDVVTGYDLDRAKKDLELTEKKGRWRLFDSV